MPEEQVPETVSLEDIKRAKTMPLAALKREMRDRFEASEEFGETGRPRYKAMYDNSLLRRNEEFLDGYAEKCRILESCNEVLKVAGNQVQMAMHMTKWRPSDGDGPTSS
jgi:hypothetical protein